MLQVLILLLPLRAGMLQYVTALRTTEFLDNETDYVPWYNALQRLDYTNMMLRSRPNIYTLYKVTHL